MCYVTMFLPTISVSVRQILCGVVMSSRFLCCNVLVLRTQSILVDQILFPFNVLCVLSLHCVMMIRPSFSVAEGQIIYGVVVSCGDLFLLYHDPPALIVPVLDLLNYT